jgi:hypothetical protein
LSEDEKLCEILGLAIKIWVMAERGDSYANAPTNLADNRIGDLAISDAFTLRPGWRVDLNFRIIQSNGAAEGLSEVQGVLATSPPITTALPKSIQYEIGSNEMARLLMPARALYVSPHYSLSATLIRITACPSERWKAALFGGVIIFRAGQ